MKTNLNPSHKEIEVKILEVNPQEIRKKLKALGAKQFFKGEVHAISYDYPDKRLEKSGKMLRVRKAGGRIELCFKGPNESEKFKIREEIEVLTSSFEDTIKIIESIGFKKFYERKKKRECYRLGSIKFDMDTYPGVPTYLEIEAPTTEEVAGYVKKLGYSMSQTTNMTGLQVIHSYGEKHQ